ncbi:Gfo/Idh/MocA family protein [Pseudonocardia spinosispora]|uniref:Gfo/Idh/MocA family protein n=1 Tax=Pseudonocardia spinosispora TaxID=103441 RepID=UPI0003FADD03|nr:Gfo/Idh/MocA family oxidoreductase [Pseudonocardia spinosispora]
MSDKLRFAVLGAGVIGTIHCAAIAALSDVAELAVVADPREPAALTAARRYLAGDHTTDTAGALGRDDVDVVVVCTPSGTHADLAEAALHAGKHVVIEKPIDVSLAAADRVIAAERTSGRTVAVISQHRFDRSTEKVAAAVAAGQLGTLTSANASCAWWRGQSYYDSGDWRGTRELDGGGATINQAVHTIDLMLSVMGRPTEVFAYAGRLAHERIEVEDTAVAVVRFDGGALGTIHATTAAYPGLDASLRVFGTRGSAVISGDELTFLYASEGEPPEIAMSESGAELNQVTEADQLSPEERGLGVSHEAQLRDFVRAATLGVPPRSGTAQARTALAAVLGMYESASTGLPVRL